MLEIQTEEVQCHGQYFGYEIIPLSRAWKFERIVTAEREREESGNSERVVVAERVGKFRYVSSFGFKKSKKKDSTN
jgi:hypothetical protein